jgi:hypothetical protein
VTTAELKIRSIPRSCLDVDAEIVCDDRGAEDQVDSSILQLAKHVDEPAAEVSRFVLGAQRTEAADRDRGAGRHDDDFKGQVTCATSRR